MTKTEGLEAGRELRDAGVELAAAPNERAIAEGQIRFLELVLAEPLRTVSTDDVVDDLGREFPDAGKWRGSIPLGLVRGGAIVRAGYAPSTRPSRHSTTITLWRLDDATAARGMLDALRAKLEWLDTINYAPGKPKPPTRPDVPPTKPPPRDLFAEVPDDEEP